MRFWNALVAITLLPIVAASFHLGIVTGDDYDLAPGSGTTQLWTVLLPSGQDGCRQAFALRPPQVRRDTAGLEGVAVQLGSIVNVTLCGLLVTVHPTLDRWSTWNDTGKCYPTYPGTSTVHFARCKSTNSIIYYDMYWCDSYLCGET
ncbi:uncharacterized protein EI90DRAFT_3042700 [Cantharellus anzutake]|uniref:uncharacterized protein n=1 Tax=Cantharellus anzutake TaxID=1750568 RepID=UPI0019076244|nr:uncharacterized protein EI90DRAFT_3042700 [Cantharellus anzutake]KAF8337363.1 hypothetical protein EI90DRAFT_3042700 [Cantharellus anzutake]